MGKQLVGRDNVEQYICHEEKKLYVDQTMILSPMGKDYLRENGITIVYGGRAEACSKLDRAPASARDREIEQAIIKILKRDYGIEDVSQTAEIIKKVLAKLAGQS